MNLLLQCAQFIHDGTLRQDRQMGRYWTSRFKQRGPTMLRRHHLLHVTPKFLHGGDSLLLYTCGWRLGHSLLRDMLSRKISGRWTVMALGLVDIRHDTCRYQQLIQLLVKGIEIRHHVLVKQLVDYDADNDLAIPGRHLLLERIGYY